MRPFTKLIEFITRHHDHFYNKDIKCPVCGETMWFDDSKVDGYITDRNILHLVCHNNCCTMDIEYKSHIFWVDEI